MLRFTTVWLAATAIGVFLTACVQPTPRSSRPTDVAGTSGYPAVLPTNTQPAGYPAQPPSPTRDTGYPPSSQAQPTLAPTIPPAATLAASATAAASETPAATATAGPVFITYRNFEIDPAQTTIKVGTEVIFLIEGGLHQPYAGSAAPFIFEAPNNLGDGSRWSYTFNTARTMTILCGYHGNMSATLIVEP